MRVNRSLLLVLLAVVLTAAGCAQRPGVSAVPVAAAPTMAPGIDSMVYGQVAAPAPSPAALAAAEPEGRGLLTGSIVATNPAGSFAPPLSSVTYTPAVREGPYKLDSGDRLRIVVFGQDGLSNSYLVDASGHIAMPLIGTVLARGATTDELSSRIAEHLRQGFIREPHVAVEIEAYRPFFILGEVTAPGQYPYVANMSVETAVAIAGGFGPRGYRRQVTISRNIGGNAVRFDVPVTYPVRPGDTIIVQERWF